MPLVGDEPKYSAKLLLIAGVPIVIVTFCFSLVWHHTAHAAAGKYLSPAEQSAEAFTVKLVDQPQGIIPALAGLGATAVLAVASFALFIHYPRNLVAASLAFVNASSRIPDAWRAIICTFTGSEPAPAGDEWVALHSLHFKDPTASLVILGFYLLTLIFFSIFVVHDARMVPRKWIVALVVFVLAIRGEGIVWDILSRLIS
jgi:hypothetical protein